jgi:hypothetical protein
MTCLRIFGDTRVSLALVAPAFAQQASASRQLEIIDSDLVRANASGAAKAAQRPR